jgi:hypothetical protein
MKSNSTITTAIPPPLSPTVTPFPSYPAQEYHKLFPINFLFAKLNHHLLGLSLPSSYILASSLLASSWRTWLRYWRKVSASWRVEGGLNICEASISKLVNVESCSEEEKENAKGQKKWGGIPDSGEIPDRLGSRNCYRVRYSGLLSVLPCYSFSSALSTSPSCKKQDPSRNHHDSQ